MRQYSSDKVHVFGSILRGGIAVIVIVAAFAGANPNLLNSHSTTTQTTNVPAGVTKTQQPRTAEKPLPKCEIGYHLNADNYCVQ